MEVTEKGAAQCRPSLTERKHRMEKDYIVTIRATVTKPIHVKAKSLTDAEETAHELFTLDNDDSAEKYEQETVSAAWSDWTGHDG